MTENAAVEFSDDPRIAAAVPVEIYMLGRIYFVNLEVGFCAIDAKLWKDRISKVVVEWI